MTLEQFSFLVAVAGTVAYAVSAVLRVSDGQVNLFGALVLGGITAVGGGTVRDIILDVPVFWSGDLLYIWLALGASLVTFYAFSWFAQGPVRNLFLYIDGIASALFAIEATGRAWDMGFGLPVAPVILGVVTAIGGGLIRDTLMQHENLLISRELYAIPIVLGSTLFAFILAFAPEYRVVGSVACLSLIFGIRAAAIKWHIDVPDWAVMGLRQLGKRSIREK